MNTTKGSVRNYFTKPAEQWVSTFVLLGCVAICVVLLYMAYKASVIGSKLSLKDNVAAELNQ
jgi:hypothetical protein